MCGAVKYKATIAGTFSACYCKMCQRWSSGAYIAAPTSQFELTGGDEKLTVYHSSVWAQRAFCTECGSNIYYCAPEHGGKNIALGTLDDTSGLEITVQYFIDRKPEGFSLAESTKTLTQSEIEAMTETS